MSHDFGLQTASGHLTVSEESRERYPADVEAGFRADAAKLATTTATGNTLIGVALADAANPSGTGRVRLNGSFS